MTSWTTTRMMNNDRQKSIFVVAAVADSAPVVVE
jgi:hypothetical protein